MGTKAQLYRLFREDVKDSVAPYFWPDREVYQYMEEAQNAFAARTNIISDATSVAATPAVTAADPYVDLDVRILKFRGATLAGERLQIRSYEEMLASCEDLDKSGTPCVLITDVEIGRGRLWPVPVVDGTLVLSVFRLPLTSPVDGDCELEVPQQYLPALLAHMLTRAYRKADGESYAPKKADDCAREFERLCSDAMRDMSQRKSQLGVVRYGGL